MGGSAKGFCEEASMSRSAAILGCAIALTVGIQTAKAGCVNNQITDSAGRVVLDAAGNPVSCVRADGSANDQGLFGGDTPLYLGAGAVLVGGGVGAAVATSSSGNGGG